jgi:hypothetical protein
LRKSETEEPEEAVMKKIKDRLVEQKSVRLLRVCAPCALHFEGLEEREVAWNVAD